MRQEASQLRGCALSDEVHTGPPPLGAAVDHHQGDPKKDRKQIKQKRNVHHDMIFTEQGKMDAQIAQVQS